MHFALCLKVGDGEVEEGAAHLLLTRHPLIQRHTHLLWFDPCVVVEAVQPDLPLAALHSARLGHVQCWREKERKDCVGIRWTQRAFQLFDSRW